MEDSAVQTKDKNQENLSGVADTLYIPLVARIDISKRFPSYFHDARALELEKKLPKSVLGMKVKEYENIASVARYYNIDRSVQGFIGRTGFGNIVNLGAGLDTMYDRIRPEHHTFYEIDFPDVILKRQSLLGKGEREILISGNITELGWTDSIDCTLPTLLIASGVFQYFHRNEVLSFFKDIKPLFPQGEIIFDATDRFGLKMANYFVKRTGNKSAQMHFYVKDEYQIANDTGTQLMHYKPFFTDALRILSKELKTSSKILMYLGDKFKKSKLIHLRLNP